MLLVIAMLLEEDMALASGLIEAMPLLELAIWDELMTLLDIITLLDMLMSDWPGFSGPMGVAAEVNVDVELISVGVELINIEVELIIDEVVVKFRPGGETRSAPTIFGSWLMKPATSFLKKQVPAPAPFTPPLYVHAWQCGSMSQSAKHSSNE